MCIRDRTWDEADEVVESGPRPTAIPALQTRPAALPAHGETACEAPSVFRRRPVRVAGAAVATVAAASPAPPSMNAAVSDAGATAAVPADAAGSVVAVAPLPAPPELRASPAPGPAALVVAPAPGETNTELRTAADGAAGHAGAAALPPPGVANTVAPSTPAASATVLSPMAAPPGDPRLLAELQSLRAALQEQWVTLSSSVAAADVQRRNPLQARLMTRLLTAGFTPEVARRIALYAPESIDTTGADTWLQDVLTVNLRCSAEADSITERGGVFALVGPTGVGKTTTVAKLAARFAVRHGTSALGLITLDAYRVAAHEQLRSYGRILGTPVHLAQDAATLRELLASMRNRRLVLIDTGGVGPRDARLAEMLATLTQAASGAQKVQPVLLLNAASHAESLEDTARAWRAGEAAGCILTKLDEAARIGGALDCAMRHKLILLGLTNGQRVPEDWHLANSRLLAHLALKPASQLFALADDEGALMAHTPHARHDAGAVHA
jgi:flagellar biosynthesis protein FlhF